MLWIQQIGNVFKLRFQGLNMDYHVISFLQECVVGVLSTYSHGEIHSVPVYYYHDETENAFYFITKSKSSKVTNIQKSKKASFSIYSEALPRVFNAKCSAEIFDVKNDSESMEIIRKLAEVHSTREYYPSPISSIKDGDLKLVKLTVLDYQYKSYTAAATDEKVQKRA
jgi:nitroimidazol reductase NimA-like FMN-containing flavoprotein (pyridoxamine 5'-phosphate oxidase superfamily)